MVHHDVENPEARLYSSGVETGGAGGGAGGGNAMQYQYYNAVSVLQCSITCNAVSNENKMKNIEITKDSLLQNMNTLHSLLSGCQCGDSISRKCGVTPFLKNFE